MKSNGLARLGRDAEVRFTNDGTPVASLSLAFSYGKKGQDGKRPTQWVDGSLWGARAEALAPYLTKGAMVVAYLDDVHIETYQGRNGEGHKLAGRVTDLELVPTGQREESAAPQRQASAPRSAPAPASSGFDEDDLDSIPF
jgi:single-strand DNA-binding protein